MKRLDMQTILGIGLLLLGSLLLLEKFSILAGAVGKFVGVIFFLGAAYFLLLFTQNTKRNWWAVIPAMTLVGMGGSAILPQSLAAWAGSVFLGSLGLAFWIVYISNRSHWWAIIPGGVLFTLAVVSVLNETEYLGGLNTGSLFFIGIGLTFLLVALLPNPFGNMKWAFIPAGILVLMGALLGNQSTASMADYIWPVALIFTGLLVLYGFYFKK